MIPGRFPSLGLRDPAFLQGVSGPVPPITTADANTWGWWSADEYVSVTGSNGEVTAWGNKMDWQVNKTTPTDSSNFGPGTTNPRPLLSRTDMIGNWMLKTETINFGLPWSATSFTPNSATTGTFTGANGLLNQSFPYSRPGMTYRLRAKIRNISGNTNLEFYHFNAASGPATAIVIDGTLKEYTCTFTGHAGYANILVGLRDPNGAGWGQVEVTEWQLTEVGWSTTYIVNNDSKQSIQPLPDGTNRAIYTMEGLLTSFGCCFKHAYSGTHAALNQPLTVYLLYMPKRISTAGRGLFDNIPGTAWSLMCDFNPTDESVYVNAAPFARLDTGAAYAYDTWQIVTAVYNGASSGVRRNKAAAVTGTLGAIAGGITKGFALGGGAFAANASGMAIKECFIRTVGDNTATQDLFIDYLAARVGLVV